MKIRKEKKQKPFYKKWWFILGVVLVIGFVNSVGREGESEDKIVDEEQYEEVKAETEIQKDELTETKAIEYKIIQIEDISIGDVKRYSLDIIITEKASRDEIENIARLIVENSKNEFKFNALTMGFYDYQEFIGYGYTLGSVIYAPNGSMADAGEVKTGEYDKMLYNYQVKNKDWDQQLNQREAKIFYEWHHLYQMVANENVSVDESEIDQRISSEFDIDGEALNQIFTKHIEWMYLDE